MEKEATAEKESEEKKEKKKTTKKEDKKTKEINKLKEELEETKDKYLRLYSDFENFRRRNAKERLSLIKSANEELIEALLPVLDDFERAEKNFREDMDVETMKEGFTLIHHKLFKILEQKGLKAMDIQEGTSFDVELHEAVTQIPAPEESLKGKVMDVIEKGYYLQEKVVRFAKVVTGS